MNRKTRQHHEKAIIGTESLVLVSKESQMTRPIHLTKRRNNLKLNPREYVSKEEFKEMSEKLDKMMDIVQAVIQNPEKGDQGKVSDKDNSWVNEQY